jgi:hypothetical protein
MPDTPPTCQMHKKYSEVNCSNPAWPGDPDGLCILHSRNPAKDPKAFKSALVVSWKQEDYGFYYFCRVFFPGRFAPREFFGTAEFNKPVYFFGSTITRGADFFDAAFTKRAIFSKATFNGEAIFSRATFADEAIFSGATFKKGAIFSEVTIQGLIVFQNINPPLEHEPKPAFRGRFNNLRFHDRGVLRFQDVNLAQCTFTGTDLRRVEFHHVTWGSLGGRQVIYDEVKLREDEKKDPWFRKWFRSQVLPWLAFQAPYEPPPETPRGDKYGEVERLCRHLKINYLTEQDYKNAGDFHYGEMEMHRRASKWRWFPFYWYNFYRFLSGYGERPSWALGLLSLLLLGMAGLICWLGIEVGKPPHTYMAGFGDSFIYLLQKATLQRPTWAEPVGLGGKLVAAFSVLIIPGQAALFLLALRNRLGRRR